MEAQVERLGPHARIATAYDWPSNTWKQRGWPDTINSLWWPSGADEFAALFLLLDDARATLLKYLVACQVLTLIGDESTLTTLSNDLDSALSTLQSAPDTYSSLRTSRTDLSTSRLRSATLDELLDGTTTDLQGALVGSSYLGQGFLTADYSPDYLANKLTAQWTDTQNAVDALATNGGVAPRPYVVLQAILAPKEGARAGDGYDPAGIAAISSETRAAAAGEIVLMEWKLYPLAPVRLADPAAADALSGMWLLPLCDLRYFWRQGPVESDQDSVGSGSGDPTSSWPVSNVEQTEDADEWMPPLRAYPQDLVEPADYVAIPNNGTQPSISASSRRGPAADLQAAMQGWRVVCRDVRSAYNCASGGTPHSAFTGIVSDYPDNPSLARQAAGATVRAGGTGYAAGDTLTVSGGTGTPATFTVTAANATSGAATAVTLLSGGSYTAVPDNPAATSGGGSGCTLVVAYATQSYHGDATRLAGVPGVIAGGATDTAMARGLGVHKIRVRFKVSGTTKVYEVDVYPTVDDPTLVAHFTTDGDGPTDGERDHLPYMLLGVPCPTAEPDSGQIGALAAAAKRWACLYYRWRRRQGYYKFPGIAPVIPNGYVTLIRWDFSSTKFETTYTAIEGVGEPIADQVAGSSSSSAGDESFLVVLTGKDYSGPFIRYDYVRVEDSDLPDPITYTEDGSGSGAAAFPLYHEQNVDLVVWLRDQGSGSGAGSDQVPPECVVRARKGTGDWYFIDHDPRVEVVKDRDPPETATIDGVTYKVADQMRWDQYGKALVVVKKCYRVALNG